MNQPGGNKTDLRARFLAERRTLSAEDVRTRSAAIADRFFTVLDVAFPPIMCLHTFLPIRRQNEVDTWFIINRIWQDYSKISLGVPVVDEATNRLSHYSLTPTTVLRENRWGILEPPAGLDKLLPTTVDLVLVPLLAFDGQGNRVGYGRGYYDCFLAECRPDCLKVGVSLFDPVERITDVAPTDVRLSLCLTPEQTHYF